MAKWTRERCHDDLIAFIKTNDDLRDATWGKFSKKHSAASSGIVAKYLGDASVVAATGSTGEAEGATFSRVVCEYAEKFSEPTRVHRWPLCPKWVPHGATEEDPITGWLGTVADHASRTCKRCDQLAGRRAELRAEWEKANPWVDVEGRIGRHATDERTKQDRERERVLGEHGWRVLRVRSESDATDWPWSIATRTQSARKLAQLLFDEIQKGTR